MVFIFSPCSVSFHRMRRTQVVWTQRLCICYVYGISLIFSGVFAESASELFLQILCSIQVQVQT